MLRQSNDEQCCGDLAADKRQSRVAVLARSDGAARKQRRRVSLMTRMDQAAARRQGLLSSVALDD